MVLYLFIFSIRKYQVTKEEEEEDDKNEKDIKKE